MKKFLKLTVMMVAVIAALVLLSRMISNYSGERLDETLVGRTAIVKEEWGRVRSAPGEMSDEIGRREKGDVVTLTGLVFEVAGTDGKPSSPEPLWWQIELPSGDTAWMAARLLSLQTLGP